MGLRVSHVDHSSVSIRSYWFQHIVFMILPRVKEEGLKCPIYVFSIPLITAPLRRLGEINSVCPWCEKGFERSPAFMSIVPVKGRGRLLGLLFILKSCNYTHHGRGLAS